MQKAFWGLGVQHLWEEEAGVGAGGCPRRGQEPMPPGAGGQETMFSGSDSPVSFSYFFSPFNCGKTYMTQFTI